MDPRGGAHVVGAWWCEGRTPPVRTPRSTATADTAPDQSDPRLHWVTPRANADDPGVRTPRNKLNGPGKDGDADEDEDEDTEAKVERPKKRAKTAK